MKYNILVIVATKNLIDLILCNAGKFSGVVCLIDGSLLVANHDMELNIRN